MLQDVLCSHRGPNILVDSPPRQNTDGLERLAQYKVHTKPFSHHTAPPTPPFSEDDDKEHGFLSATGLIESLGPLERLPSAQFDTLSITPSSSSTSVEQQHSPCIVVIGVGYVGERLVERFGAEHEVIGVDLSTSRCTTLRTQFANNDHVTIVSDMRADKRIATFDLALISVPTTLCRDNRTVDTRHVREAVESIAKYARAGSTVVIESSVSVGTTRALLGPSGANLRAKGVYVGFSPERVDPGRTTPAFKDIPKVVAGIDQISCDVVSALYSRAFTTIVAVRSLETAEFSKLFENCQRLMMIAYANEMADAAQQHGVDMHDVCAASATKPFGYTPFTPSLGAGGHCIPVNPWYLLSNCDAPLLQAAAHANQQRPIVKAKEVYAAAMAKRRRLSPSVLIIGLGFKGGEASLSDSPSASMADTLQCLGCTVDYMDDNVAATSARWTGRLNHDDFVKGGARVLDERYDAIVVAHRLCEADYAILAMLHHSTLFTYAR